MRKTNGFATLCATAALLIAAAFAGCTDQLGNQLSGFDKENPAEIPHSILTGYAFLQQQTDHSYIRVDLPVAGFSMLTDTQGAYQLPKDLSDGDWTIRAQYPYYRTEEQTFSVSKGVPENPLDSMELLQAVQFTITTNGTFFTLGSTLIMTVAAENISTRNVTLQSTTSPMAAFAVRGDGETVAGGLFPGDVPDPESVTLDPGDTKYFELRWKIDDPNIMSGDYEVYAVLTDNGTHPEYFDKSETATPEFNASLFGKLRPANIHIN
jgi:hypothetical protein